MEYTYELFTPKGSDAELYRVREGRLIMAICDHEQDAQMIVEALELRAKVGQEAASSSVPNLAVRSVVAVVEELFAPSESRVSLKETEKLLGAGQPQEEAPIGPPDCLGEDPPPHEVVPGEEDPYDQLP